MTLPFPPDYLGIALQPGVLARDTTIIQQQIGYLELPSGDLVACDPFVNPDATPFRAQLPRGRFPVVLSIAETGSDQRVAFAGLRFKPDAPITWEMMLAGNQDASTLKADEIFGYPVDSGTGCFMDRSAARALDQTMRENPDFFQTMIDEMEKTYRHTWSWLDMKFADANLIAFSSGLGDGVYATYSGVDANGEICVLVTDFGAVAPEDLGLEG